MTAHTYNMKIEMDTSAIEAALGSLKILAKLFPERVQRFVDGLEPGVQLVRFDNDDGATSSAGNLRVLAKPSDRLAEFLATAWAIEG